MNDDDPTSPSHPPELLSPKFTRVGPYTLRRVLGRGGMGTVYEAEQEYPRRLVALKVIRESRVSPEVLRRFEYEATTLALLKHPGIAQIYEAATFQHGEETIPYFAMEYVEDACTISDWAEIKKLDLRARLELLGQACAAVHHGHLHGVIHRDLKPDNLLVDRQGLLKVIDFGVARVQAEGDGTATLLTREGQLIGTFRYMSPEQIDRPLEIDARSDVYSLGVVLYSLLAGEPPYDLDDRPVVECMRVIREVEPPRISSKNPKVNGELELVVHMALAKDPEQRYPSANALLEDLRSFLKGGLVTARPPSALYQLRVLARRHRVLVTSSLAVLMALIIGLVSSTRLYYQAEQQRLLAESATQRALDQERKTRDALEESTRQASISAEVRRFLSDDVLGAANPMLTPDPNVTVRSILQGAGQEIDRRFSAEPTVAAALHSTIANAFFGLGLLEEASSHIDRALFLQNQHGDQDELALLNMRTIRALTTFRQGDYQPALDELLACHEELLRTLGPAHQDTLQNVGSIAYAQLEIGDLEGAQAMLDEFLPHGRRLEPEHRQTRLLMELHYAGLLLEQEKYAQATEHYSSMVQTASYEFGKRSLYVISIRVYLGLCYHHMGRYLDAEQVYQETLRDALEVLGEEHPEVQVLRHNLALTYTALGRHQQALEISLQELEVSEQQLGRDHPAVLVSISNLGRLYLQLDQIETAERLLGEASEGLLEVTPEKPITGISHHIWGHTLMELGYHEEAIDVLLAAHELLGEHMDEDHAEMRDLQALMALCYVELGMPEEASTWRQD